MSEQTHTEQSVSRQWCVLGRWRQEVGSWSWVATIKAASAEEALREALRRGQIHGYYVAIPWDVAARAETSLRLIDPEGNRI